VIEQLYRFLSALSRFTGLWILRVVSSCVAAGYFILFPRRLGHSIRFYRALYPDRSALHALRRAWCQYQDFASLYCERLEIERRSDVRFESEGQHHLKDASAAGRGAILLMSHFGRWEIGAKLLARRKEDLMLVMGGEVAGGARGGVDEDLRQAGVDVVTVPAGEGQAFDILQAVQSLRKGGVVSLAADRAFGEARMLRLPFLGHTVAIAAAPFALALVSGSPLLLVFAVKMGSRHYRFICDPPITLTTPGRAERQQVMQEAAAAYLDRLGAMVRAHPEQWQTFGEFLRRED